MPGNSLSGSTIDFLRRDGGRLESAAAIDFVEPNLNLLAHAQAIELEIGSRCGGHGVCGGDRIRIVEGAPLSGITDAERRHLTPDELADGYRLACQCFPNRADASLRVEILPD